MTTGASFPRKRESSTLVWPRWSAACRCEPLVSDELPLAQMDSANPSRNGPAGPLARTGRRYRPHGGRRFGRRPRRRRPARRRGPTPPTLLDLGGADTPGVFALDVLACPRCGGRRRLIAPVHDPGVVRALLAHLGLAPDPDPPRTGPAPARPRRGHRVTPGRGPGGPLTVRSEFSSIDGDCRQGRRRLNRSRGP